MPAKVLNMTWKQSVDFIEQFTDQGTAHTLKGKSKEEREAMMDLATEIMEVVERSPLSGALITLTLLQLSVACLKHADCTSCPTKDLN